MKWDPEKNARLKLERGVSFEEIIQAEPVGVIKHSRRTHQHLLLFLYKGYVWVVPYVHCDGGRFLKTLFPSRKYTKMLKRGELL